MRSTSLWLLFPPTYSNRLCHGNCNPRFLQSWISACKSLKVQHLLLQACACILSKFHVKFRSHQDGFRRPLSKLRDKGYCSLSSKYPRSKPGKKHWKSHRVSCQHGSHPILAENFLPFPKLEWVLYIFFFEDCVILKTAAASTKGISLKVPWEKKRSSLEDTSPSKTWRSHG